ncbi:MAG: AbrB/MazE/SpoVT family DNA-binding domain-containing protein [Bacilli bacterium]|nr:AbrB/MazE/SpoVT family DNA-binding domain-containing protein [Bacilli bacterium]
MNGQIKRIDELGRIVIPKDIRKRLSIKTNDTLEIGMDGDKIVLNKRIAIKEYNDYVKTLLTILTNYSGIKFLATNREDIIFNNTDIEGFEVKKYINMSLYEMDKVKDDICSGCDIRPVIIDSNVEGIIIVINSECNKEIGKIINILVTSKLDISC